MAFEIIKSFFAIEAAVHGFTCGRPKLGDQFVYDRNRSADIERLPAGTFLLYRIVVLD